MARAPPRSQLDPGSIPGSIRAVRSAGPIPARCRDRVGALGPDGHDRRHRSFDSSPAARRADPPRVHFERLVIESGADTFSLDLHRQMTVIAGVGRPERDGLITELIGGLGRGRSGVHLEIASDAGTRYAIFRPGRGPPPGGRHRRRRRRHRASSPPATRLDVLERAGLGQDAGPAPAVHGPERPGDPVPPRGVPPAPGPHRPGPPVGRRRPGQGARAPPGRQRRGRRLRRRGRGDVRGDRAPPPRLRGGPGRPRAGPLHLVPARRRLRPRRRASPPSLLGHAGSPCPSSRCAVGATVASIVYWQRVEQARRDEEAALRSAGTNSYLSFQINRVNGLLTSDHARRQMMRAAEEHRAALAEWRVLVGDIPVDWAIEHARRDPPAGGPAARHRRRAEPDGDDHEPRRGDRRRAGPQPAAAAGRCCGRSAPAARASRCCSTTRSPTSTPTLKPELLELLMKASAAPAGDLPDRRPRRGRVGPGRGAHRRHEHRRADADPPRGRHRPPVGPHRRLTLTQPDRRPTGRRVVPVRRLSR